MDCKSCNCLWVKVLRELYEKLSLTRGQIAVASELLAREYFSGNKTESIIEAVKLSLQKVDLDGEVVNENDIYKVKVPGVDCQLRNICPLPFYVAASVRILTERKIYVVSKENVVDFKEGYCSFDMKVVDEG